MEKFFEDIQHKVLLSSVGLAFIEHNIDYEHAIDKNNNLKLNVLFDSLDPVTNLNLINSIYLHYTNFSNELKCLFSKPMQKQIRIKEQKLYLDLAKYFETKIKH